MVRATSAASAAPMTLGAVLLAIVIGSTACSNDPYPAADATQRILYTAFDSPPKTLDPTVSYTVVDHAVIGPVYDTLLDYHYLERPYRLLPALLEGVPEPEPLPDGGVRYRLRLRPGLRFHEDACFGTTRTRHVTAADMAFTFMRMADPAVTCPVAETFGRVRGFAAFGEALVTRREADTTFAAERIDRQYAAVGGIAGVRVVNDLELHVDLTAPWPQLVYWLAMPFTTPVPWEAVTTYDGTDGREAFAEHPVGTGPFRLAHYDKRSRIVLERNPSWWGVAVETPGTRYPRQGEPGDAEAGWLDPAYVGRPLPFLDRVEFRLDKEDIPAFTKFLQGYYDASGIVQESFDRVVRDGRLSAEMAALGMRLDKTVTPYVGYLGFNMDDPVVGAAGGDRARKLRQAMSLVIDVREYTRVFQNGRGVPAQSPIPPGIFGYDPAYVNPYRQVDPERAAVLLREAGYGGGVDPSTGKPLHLTFDTMDTSSRGRLRYQFFVDAWRKLGLDVEIVATSYNQFQDKVRRGAYQLFQWGWVADYPDPENFLFLLWSDAARSKGGPNTANFRDPRYDRVFVAMRDRPNDDERLRLVAELRAILETERPWIELFHEESFGLSHGWLRNRKPFGMSYPTLKYLDVDPVERARLRRAWNVPITWPAWVLAGMVFVAVGSGVLMRRRGR